MRQVVQSILAAIVLVGLVGWGAVKIRPDLVPRVAGWVGIHAKPGVVPAGNAEAEVAASPMPLPAAVLSKGDRLTVGLFTGGGLFALEAPFPVVELESEEIAPLMGFEYAVAQLRQNVPKLVGNAEIAYNANLYAEVRPRVSGIIREVLVDEGSHLHAGDPMIVVDSADVGTAKADYLAALPIELLSRQTLDMTLSLRKSNAAPLKEEMAARADYNKERAELLHTRQQLLNLGYTDDDLARFARDQDTSNLHTVVAPIDGYVVERHAVSGEALDPEHKLFGVADTRLMWAWIDVYEESISVVDIGQHVTLYLFGAEDQSFEGRVDWIDTAANPTTRTIRVRAEMLNPTGRLRVNQFGRAAITIGPPRGVVVVPRTAIQTVNGLDVVFIPLDAKTFGPRRVAVASADEPGLVQVANLPAGARVVTEGSFLLKSELLKDQIAGEE